MAGCGNASSHFLQFIKRDIAENQCVTLIDKILYPEPIHRCHYEPRTGRMFQRREIRYGGTVCNSISTDIRLCKVLYHAAIFVKTWTERKAGPK